MYEEQIGNSQSAAQYHNVTEVLHIKSSWFLKQNTHKDGTAAGVVCTKNKSEIIKVLRSWMSKRNTHKDVKGEGVGGDLGSALVALETVEAKVKGKLTEKCLLSEPLRSGVIKIGLDGINSTRRQSRVG